MAGAPNGYAAAVAVPAGAPAAGAAVDVPEGAGRAAGALALDSELEPDVSSQFGIDEHAPAAKAVSVSVSNVAVGPPRMKLLPGKFRRPATPRLRLIYSKRVNGLRGVTAQPRVQ